VLIKFLKLAAAPFSGILMVFAFPPYNLHFIAWIALIPLLYSLDNSSTKGSLLRGYLFGVAFLSFLFWWFTVVRYPASLGYVAFAIIIPAIFIPWAYLACLFMKKKSPFFRIWFPAALWVVLEWGMSHGTFALPWWSLGNTQVSNLVISQLASIGSIYLISFLVLSVNIFFFSLLSGNFKRYKSSWIILGAILLCSIIFGVSCLREKNNESNPVKISMIQPNYSQNEKDEQINFSEMFHNHFHATEKVVGEYHPDIVLWSESVTFYSWLAGPTNIDFIKSKLKRLNITLISGIYDWKSEEENYNSVIAIDSETGLLGKYDKINVVPFGEMIPYRKSIEKISGWAGKWLKEQALAYDTTKGKEFKVFDSKSGRFSTMICFESVFPHISRIFANKGAEYLFIITNDAWFLKTPGTYQHASMAALRAIETRKYTVQASNSGVTQIIDPYGRIIDSLNVLEPGVLNGMIYPNSNKTIYMLIGDSFCLLSLIYVLVCIFLSFLISKRKTL